MMEPPTTLERLAAELARLPAGAFVDAAVATLLAEHPCTAADLAPYVTLGAEAFTRRRVGGNAAFELLILYWPAALQSPIHGHGGSRCWMRVVAGELAVDDYTLVDGGREPGPARIDRAASGLLGPGDIDARSDDKDLHRVGALEACAVSLHVYAAPIAQFLIFDERGESCRWGASRYDAD